MYDEAAIIKAYKEGNKEVFNRLVIKHQHHVFNLCYRFLGDYDDANDAAQETFIKAYRNLGKFRQDAAFSTWLYRIAVNTCKNKQRSLFYRFRRQTVSLSDHENKGREKQVANGGDSPLNELSRLEKQKLIQQAIAALPYDQRILIVLRDVESYSYDDIAKMTSLNIGTVKSKLARGRERLRDKLKDLL